MIRLLTTATLALAALLVVGTTAASAAPDAQWGYVYSDPFTSYGYGWGGYGYGLTGYAPVVVASYSSYSYPHYHHYHHHYRHHGR